MTSEQPPEDDSLEGVGSPRPEPIHLEPRQENILRWLNQRSLGLAELYWAAFRLVNDQVFPARVRLVSHAVREIRNRLPEIVAGHKGGKQFQYKPLLDKLVEEWEKGGLPLDDTITRSTATGEVEEVPIDAFGPLLIPGKLAHDIRHVLRDHKLTREKPREAALRLYETFAPRDEDIREALKPLAEEAWVNVTGWFASKAHQPMDNIGEPSNAELALMFSMFEQLLETIIIQIPRVYEDIDEILGETNP